MMLQPGYALDAVENKLTRLQFLHLGLDLKMTRSDLEIKHKISNCKFYNLDKKNLTTPKVIC